jgi:isoleucyl-tRNA synthetase
MKKFLLLAVLITVSAPMCLSLEAEEEEERQMPAMLQVCSEELWNKEEQIAVELNVIDLEDIASADGELVDISIKANFRTLGTKFGGAVQDIAKAISAQNPAELVATLRASASTKVSEWEISLDDLVVTETPKSGWNVASHDGESVALDLALSPTLISAGLVREVVRFIQDARKTSGFDISDRISITYNANADVMTAIAADLAHIQGEVLATQMQADTAISTGDNELGLTVKLVKQA